MPAKLDRGDLIEEIIEIGVIVKVDAFLATACNIAS